MEAKAEEIVRKIKEHIDLTKVWKVNGTQKENIIVAMKKTQRSLNALSKKAAKPEYKIGSKEYERLQESLQESINGNQLVTKGVIK